MEISNKKCRHFDKYKAVYPPRCNCAWCWKKYFETHPGTTMAVSSAINRISRGAAISAYGSKFVKHFERFVRGEYAKQAG